MAENHALYLGKLLGNLQSLESLLRLYLLACARQPLPQPPSGPDYWELTPGDRVPVDAFTDYRTLGQLISAFNASVSHSDPTLTVPQAVVLIRDLLAHGRVSAKAADPTLLKIIKFNAPPKGFGEVTVAAVALMSEEWFTSHIEMTRIAIEHVQSAYTTLAT